MITFKEYLAEISIKGKAVKADFDEKTVIKIIKAIVANDEHFAGGMELKDLSLIFGEITDEHDISKDMLCFENYNVLEFFSDQNISNIKPIKLINGKEKYDEMIEYCKKENILW